MSTSPDDSGQWHKTEFAVIVAVFLYFGGTSFVIPFLPLYVMELDDLDVPTAALWSGAILGIAPLVSGVVAPFWGRLSDRFGHKVLLQRSLLGFTICLGLMGIARSPLDLLIIRGLMGLVGGFSVATQALISVSAPRSQVMSAIGRTNAARVLGMAIGPIPGGVLADAVGVRGACLASVAGGVVALIVVTVLAKAPRIVRMVGPRPTRRERTGPLLSGGFPGLLLSVTATRLVEKSYDPVLPLLIASLYGNPFGTGTTTALVSSAGLLATAIGAGAAGRLGGRSSPARGLRLRALLLAASLLTAATFFASFWGLLLALRAAVGFAVGLAGSLAIAQAALATPLSRRGAAMGVIGSGTAFGAAAGSAGAGLLAPLALPAVFILDAVLLGGTSLILWLRRESLQRDDDQVLDASS